MSATLHVPSTLIVEPSLDDLPSFVLCLSEAGFRVTAAATYLQARTLLDARAASLLITEVRLGAYNGLHLVIRAKTATPPIPAIVMSSMDDPVLRAETEAMGATFLVKPFAGTELRAAALRTMLGDPHGAPPRAPFERRESERRRDATPCPRERRVGERRRRLEEHRFVPLDRN